MDSEFPRMTKLITVFTIKIHLFIYFNYFIFLYKVDVKLK